MSNPWDRPDTMLGNLATALKNGINAAAAMEPDVSPFRVMFETIDVTKDDPQSSTVTEPCIWIVTSGLHTEKDGAGYLQGSVTVRTPYTIDTQEGTQSTWPAVRSVSIVVSDILRSFCGIMWANVEPVSLYADTAVSTHVAQVAFREIH